MKSSSSAVWPILIRYSDTQRLDLIRSRYELPVGRAFTIVMTDYVENDTLPDDLKLAEETLKHRAQVFKDQDYGMADFMDREFRLADALLRLWKRRRS